jgi:hypothetical protein
MTAIEKFTAFGRKFYLTALGLTIPFYLLLYGASGHKFDPPAEDIIWMTIIVAAFVLAILNSMLKEKSGPIVNGLFSLALLATTYGGIRVFVFMVSFDYDDEISFIFKWLSYLIPLLFSFSSIMNLFSLFAKRSTA